MSEPVGNGPRMSNIPSNSHKSKEPPAPARPAMEKVIEGKIVQRKDPFWRRVSKSMIAEDASTVGDFLLEDVVIPSLKDLLRNIIFGSVERTLYGRASVPGSRSFVGSGVTNLRTAYHNVPAQSPPRPALTQSARANHAFTEYTFERREDALSVLSSLIQGIEEYGSVSVKDLYDLLGITDDFTSRGWGWTNLEHAEARQARGGGWFLDLPPTKPLKN